jgi:hypothetical protein
MGYHCVKAQSYAGSAKAHRHHQRAAWHAAFGFGGPPPGSEAYNAAIFSERLCDPITREMFVDPVVVSNGHTFERESIEGWIKQSRPPLMCPKTMTRITSRLVPNLRIIPMVVDFIEAYGKRDGVDWEEIKALCDRQIQRRADLMAPTDA